MLASALLGSLLVATPAAGEVVADFEVQDTEGRTHRLGRMLEDGPVILVFFPKAFTGG